MLNEWSPVPSLQSMDSSHLSEPIGLFAMTKRDFNTGCSPGDFIYSSGAEAVFTSNGSDDVETGYNVHVSSGGGSRDYLWYTAANAQCRRLQGGGFSCQEATSGRGSFPPDAVAASIEGTRHSARPPSLRRRTLSPPRRRDTSGENTVSIIPTRDWKTARSATYSWFGRLAAPRRNPRPGVQPRRCASSHSSISDATKRMGPPGPRRR